MYCSIWQKNFHLSFHIKEKRSKLFVLKLSFALGVSRALSITLVRSRRLSCAQGDTCVLSMTFVSSRRLSCTLGDTRALSVNSYTLGDTRALSVTLVRSRRLSCALGDTRALSMTLVRLQRLSCALRSLNLLEFLLESTKVQTLSLSLFGTKLSYAFTLGYFRAQSLLSHEFCQRSRTLATDCMKRPKD